MLTQDEKVRARHHLGYANVSEAATFQMGIPAGIQTQFMIEQAFNLILPQAEEKLRGLLEKLDEIECQIVNDTENVAVEEIGTIKLREDEFKQLIIRYQHWQGALANLLAIRPNPFDQRGWLGSGYGGGGGMNAPVWNG